MAVVDAAASSCLTDSGIDDDVEDGITTKQHELEGNSSNHDDDDDDDGETPGDQKA